MSVVAVLSSLLNLDSPIDERPLSLFQGSVSEWSDMRTISLTVTIYVSITSPLQQCCNDMPPGTALEQHHF
ncbi:hypothetical protein F443_21086 [Phytophthora nicotianae P1569]|uniref:Uncharacterized protein n=1 Tax=Phytophthora nicotianae P1569 TaxID=1317065 RepID=V9DYV6_PHYNI|nr:hypothetical protein F443_21086 [Phytophthora nicotianae P1569]